MSIVAVFVVTLLYLLAAVDELLNGRPSTALMLLGYSIANVGLMWGMLR